LLSGALKQPLSRFEHKHLAAQSAEDSEFKYDAYKQANALLTEIFNEDRAHPINNWPDQSRAKAEERDS